MKELQGLERGKGGRIRENYKSRRRGKGQGEAGKRPVRVREGEKEKGKVG